MLVVGGEEGMDLGEGMGILGQRDSRQKEGNLRGNNGRGKNKA